MNRGELRFIFRCTIVSAHAYTWLSHSSIVAFALCSQAYRDKLNEPDLALPPRVVERSEAFMPPSTTDSSELPPPLMHDRSGTTSTGWGVVDLEEERADVDTTLRKTSAKHFRLQFEEGTTSFYCKIFFAEQFDALRRQTGCESQFTESLARCVSWISSGGRSNVDFLKTKGAFNAHFNPCCSTRRILK